jgi:hypothetical protein
MPPRYASCGNSPCVGSGSRVSRRCGPTPIARPSDEQPLCHERNHAANLRHRVCESWCLLAHADQATTASTAEWASSRRLTIESVPRLAERKPRRPGFPVDSSRLGCASNDAERMGRAVAQPLRRAIAAAVALILDEAAARDCRPPRRVDGRAVARAGGADHSGARRVAGGRPHREVAGAGGREALAWIIGGGFVH